MSLGVMSRMVQHLGAAVVQQWWPLFGGRWTGNVDGPVYIVHLDTRQLSGRVGMSNPVCFTIPQDRSQRPSVLAATVCHREVCWPNRLKSTLVEHCSCEYKEPASLV